MKDYTLIFIAMVSVVALVIGVEYAVSLQDQIACYNWQHEAAVKSNFYITKDEAGQCSFWHIPVDALVAN